MNHLTEKIADQVLLPGGLPTWLRKGDILRDFVFVEQDGSPTPEGKVVLEVEVKGRSVGFDRDEVQTLVDFAIAALEEAEEAEKQRGLKVDDLNVGGLYEVVADSSSHEWPIGTLVHYLGHDGHAPLATRNLNATEWQESEKFGGPGDCRAVSGGDLGYVRNSPFER